MATAPHRRAVTSTVGQTTPGQASVVTQEMVPYQVETFAPAAVESPAALARALERVQRHGADATVSARSLPCLGGSYWPACKLTGGQTLQLPHALGVEVAFIPVSIRNVTGAAPTIVEVGQSADKKILFLKSTATCTADIWVFPRPKAVGSALAHANVTTTLLGGGTSTGLYAPATTTAAYVQPAVGSSVTVQVTSTAGMMDHGFVSVVGGGRYTVAASGVVDATHVTLVYRGGAPGAAVGATVPSGSIVTFLAPSPLETLQSTLSPFALRPVNNIAAPEFGATGVSGSVDRAAINAASVAAQTNGYPVYFPPGVWLTDQQITPPPGVTWMGDGAAPGTSVLQATTSMASVVQVHNTDAPDATQTAKRNLFVDLTFDANALATHAVLDQGSFLTRWERCTFENGLHDGERIARNRLPGTVSGVTATVPGGSPAGVTIVQLDPTFLVISGSTTNHMVLKVQGGGTTFVLSYDGGSTFQTYQQRIVAGGSANILFTGGAVALGPTGLRVTFPAGTYHDNDTYAVTVTPPTEDGGTFQAINTDNRYVDCWWQYNGTCYGTSGILGRFGDQPRTITISGTASTTSGSTEITLTGGTAGMSLIVREGDILQLNNVTFAVLAMPDDNHVLVPTAGAPAFTGSGYDYALLVGAGRREDAGAEQERANIYNGRARYNPTNFRFAGQQGPVVQQTRCEFYAALAYAIGSQLSPMNGSAVLIAPHVEFGDVACESIYVWPNTAPVRVLEPPEQWSYGSSLAFGAQRLLQKGNEFAIAGGATSSVPLYVESHVITPQTIGSASQQIAAPSLTTLTMTTDIEIACTADFLSTAAPFFTGLGSVPDGVVLQLYNAGSHSLTFAHDTLAGSGIYTVGEYDTLSPRGTWRMRVKSGKAVVIGRSTTWGGLGGNDGEPTRRLTTTSNATPTILYDWDVAGIVAGTNVWIDVLAQSLDGQNTAAWLGYSFQVSSASGHGTLTGVVAGTTMLSSGATALGWAISWGFDVSTQFFRFFGTGDTSGNAVTWKVIVREMSAGA